MTTSPLALDLLRLAEQYLSALHGSVARHDSLGLNLSCGGCALRDEIRDALPTLADAVPEPPATRTAAQATLRDCIARALAATELKPPFPHCLAMADAVLAVLPPPADRAALLDRIADAIRAAACTGDCGDTEDECARTRVQPGARERGVLVEVYGRPEVLADVVLGMAPAPTDRADRGAVLAEAAGWLKTWRPEFFERWAITEQERYEGGVDDAAAELLRMADEAQQPEPETRCTCADAGACFAPAGHYADCPALETPAARARQDDPPVVPCPPGCVACATDESHDPAPAAGARQDGAQS